MMMMIEPSALAELSRKKGPMPLRDIVTATKPRTDQEYRHSNPTSSYLAYDTEWPTTGKHFYKGSNKPTFQGRKIYPRIE